MTQEFNLSEKIFSANNKSKTFIELYNLEIILKEFIKWCEEHSCMEDGVQMISINKLKEGAGEDLE